MSARNLDVAYWSNEVFKMPNGDLEIKEAYYNKHGVPRLWCNPDIYGEDLKELGQTLAYFRDAWKTAKKHGVRYGITKSGRIKALK